MTKTNDRIRVLLSACATHYAIGDAETGCACLVELERLIPYADGALPYLAFQNAVDGIYRRFVITKVLDEPRPRGLVSSHDDRHGYGNGSAGRSHD